MGCLGWISSRALRSPRFARPGRPLRPCGPPPRRAGRTTGRLCADLPSGPSGHLPGKRGGHTSFSLVVTHPRQAGRTYLLQPRGNSPPASGEDLTPSASGGLYGEREVPPLPAEPCNQSRRWCIEWLRHGWCCG
jgi:hypothetical protein